MAKIPIIATSFLMTISCSIADTVPGGMKFLHQIHSSPSQHSDIMVGETSSNTRTNERPYNIQGSNAAGGEIFSPRSFPLSGQEPTCEQLRAMWIFSKRKSRASEMTNEIPTYRDPLRYNTWHPYSSTASFLQEKSTRRDQLRSPVFGRIVSREPFFPQSINYLLPSKFDGTGNSKLDGSEAKPLEMGSLPARHLMQYRFVGGGSNAKVHTNKAPLAVQGSFQKLKEIIWTERARELTEQRRAEELAARSAALKDTVNGERLFLEYKHSSSDGNTNLKNGIQRSSKNMEPTEHEHSYGILSMPNGKTNMGPSFLQKPAWSFTDNTRVPLTVFDRYRSPSDRKILTAYTKDQNKVQSQFRERTRSSFNTPFNPRNNFHRDQRALQKNKVFDNTSWYLKSSNPEEYLNRLIQYHMDDKYLPTLLLAYGPPMRWGIA